MGSAVSGVIYSLMNWHSFSIVSFEFIFTKFFMLKVRIDILSSMSDERALVAILLIYSFDSRDKIFSLMYYSNSGLYVTSAIVIVLRISFLVV